MNRWENLTWKLRHYLFVIPKRPRRLTYWTVCTRKTERALFRNNRWWGNFDQWVNNEWVDKRDMYWRVTTDIGYRTKTWRARKVRRALSRGEKPPCRHNPDEYC
jgi:hypothetical protein